MTKNQPRNRYGRWTKVRKSSKRKAGNRKAGSVAQVGQVKDLGQIGIGTVGKATNAEVQQYAGMLGLTGIAGAIPAKSAHVVVTLEDRTINGQSGKAVTKIVLDNIQF